MPKATKKSHPHANEGAETKAPLGAGTTAEVATTAEVVEVDGFAACTSGFWTSEFIQKPIKMAKS